MAQPLIYVDRSDVRQGSIEPLREGVARVVAFIQEREPQLLAYGFHIDEETLAMSVTAVHPDASSLERHLRIGGPEFQKVGEFITLRSIDVYGELPDDLMELLHAKARMLGGESGASVAVHPRTVGFSRIP